MSNIELAVTTTSFLLAKNIFSTRTLTSNFSILDAIMDRWPTEAESDFDVGQGSSNTKAMMLEKFGVATPRGFQVNAITFGGKPAPANPRCREEGWRKKHTEPLCS